MGGSWGRKRSSDDELLKNTITVNLARRLLRAIRRDEMTATIKESVRGTAPGRKSEPSDIFEKLDRCGGTTGRNAVLTGRGAL